MYKGKFIVFEGINGCGKGTQLGLFHNYLLSKGKAVPIFTTGEPSRFSDWGAKARGLLSSAGDPVSRGQEAVEYFSFDRAEHNNVFLPLIGRGVDVLCDRYWHSTFAFQMAQGVGAEHIARSNAGFRIPDLTLVFDLSAGVAGDRLSKRDGKDRRLFDKDLSFLERVRQNYLNLQSILPSLLGDNSVVVIDGSKSIDEIAGEVIKVHSERFNKKN